MIFLLNLPPPVHGMSFINKQILTMADSVIEDLYVINTTPSETLGSANFFRKLKRYFTMFFNFWKVLHKTRINECIYRPINGGKGQLIDILFILLMRSYRRKIYLHHHSYNYINSKSYLFSLLNLLVGKDTTHIVLSRHMQNGLMAMYGIKEQQFRVLSNCAFIEEQSFKYESVQEHSLIKIGYLSNVTVTKGIDVFLEICERLINSGLNIQAIIAGPYNDKDSELLVSGFCQKNKNAIYTGPIYGQQKEDFFKEIDVFVFPSKYKNEAEPLVIYEAASFGSYVVGSEVGTMKEAIKKMAGISFPLKVDSNENEINCYIENVVNHLTEIKKIDYKKISINVINSFKAERNDNIKVMHSLLKEFENVSTGTIQGTKRL